jgi:hypothetical protein
VVLDRTFKGHTGPATVHQLSISVDRVRVVTIAVATSADGARVVIHYHIVT